MNEFSKKKIDKNFYNDSEYFNKKLDVFSDLESPFQKYRISKVLQIYTPNNNEKVLDLGCGWGTFCFAVASRCKEIVGVDFSQKSIDICNSFSAGNENRNIRFVCADAQDTGLESGSFDVIFCADLFEHLYPENSKNVLDECDRLLKKGGKIVIWTPHRGHILEILKNNNIILKRDESHVDYKSMQYFIDELQKRGFSIVKNYYAESHIPVFRLLEKSLSWLLPIMRRRIAILAEKI